MSMRPLNDDTDFSMVVIQDHLRVHIVGRDDQPRFTMPLEDFKRLLAGEIRTVWMDDEDLRWMVDANLHRQHERAAVAAERRTA